MRKENGPELATEITKTMYIQPVKMPGFKKADLETYTLRRMLYVLNCNVAIILEKKLFGRTIVPENDAIFKVKMHFQPSNIPDSE